MQTYNPFLDSCNNALSIYWRNSPMGICLFARIVVHQLHRLHPNRLELQHKYSIVCMHAKQNVPER